MEKKRKKGGGKPAKKRKLASGKKAEANAVYEELLALLEASPEGMREDAVKKHFDGKLQLVAEAITRLLQGRLRLFEDQEGRRVYKLVDDKVPDDPRLRLLDASERMAYQFIKEAQAVGIPRRKLTKSTGLPGQVLTRALKHLETQKLIKWVKSPGSHVKVYVLFDVKPEILSGHQLSEEVTDVLYRVCSEYFRREASGCATAIDVAKWVVSTAVLNKVTETQIVYVLNAMVMDGTLERATGPEAAGILKPQFRAPRNGPLCSDVLAIPCLRCPVSGQCTEGGVISPATCKYFTEWLAF